MSTKSPVHTNRGKTKRFTRQHNSVNQCREVDPKEIESYQRRCTEQWRRERARGQCIEDILSEKRYWFDPLRQEEEMKNCLFAQTLFRVSDEKLAQICGEIYGEERSKPTYHTLYNEADEKEAIEEADREFERLNVKTKRPTLILEEDGTPNVPWRGVSTRSPLSRPKLKRERGIDSWR